MALLLVGAGADYAFYPLLAPAAGRSGDTGENGLWLRYTWYFGEHRPEEVRAMARRLNEDGFRYAYFHVRYAEHDGTLHFRYPERALPLNAAVHRDAPGVKSIAWIYVGNRHGLGGVDLDDAKTRANLAAQAAWLVTKCGFDGVQWDYEICGDGDQGFLALLQESRAALPKGALLSVAAPVWMPPPVSVYGWSEKYFGEVAARCDQIAVMTYDTGAYFPRAYVWITKQQVVHVTRAVRQANPDCRVLIGLPTYGEGTASHNPRAENLRLGLKGVREGVESVGNSLAGVALFADYTTTEDEWQTYRRLWTAR